MIGTLMYLTSSRPDLVFAVCICARYQAKPTEKHLHAVKRIFRYLRGTINMGLWYSKDSCITLTAFADADHVGCQNTRKSTSESMQLLGDRLEQVENGVVELYFVKTEYQLTDIFTKPLALERLDFLINKLEIRNVPKIFMQKFWCTIKKVQGIESYEFLLANKKCRFDAEVFRKILDICPRVEGEEFTKLQNDDNTLTFLIDLGYKSPLDKENVDYPELIWEDFAYQIDHKRERKSRRENMPYPRFTKVIINHFLKQHKSLSNLKYQHYHTIKDDGIVSRLKFVRIGEDYQEYGLAIPDETVDVSEESEPEHKPIKRKTTSRRVVKKTVTISADDNIIPDPDVDLELGKSISLAEDEEEEAAKQVHATHERIVTESVLESAKKKTASKSSRSVVIQDTPKAADIMQALKESKKTNKIQPGTRGSSEGTSTIPGVPDESIVVSATSSEGTEEDQLDDEEKDDKEGDADDEGDAHISDTQDTNDETESDKDEIYKYKIRVRKDEDVEMTNAEVEDSKKAELPPTSSSLSASSGFGDQFLNLSSDNSLVGTVKDTTDIEINSLLDIKIQSKVPHIQSPSVLKVLVSMISEPFVLTPVQETSTAAPITTLPPPPISTIAPAPLQQTTTPIPSPLITTDAPIITSAVPESDALSAVQLRVAKLEKDVSELKKIDHFTKSLATLKSQVPTVVEQYLRTKIDDDLQRVLQRHTTDLIQKYSHDDDIDDEDPPTGPNQGKKTKMRITKKSESSKKPSSTKETPKGKAPLKGSKTNVVHDDDQPQGTSEPKTSKIPNPKWFKQPPRPPNLDPEWNKRQVVLGQPEQPWFNQMVSTTKDPLTFNDLMATPIDFSKYVLNQLKIDNLTQDLLLGSAYDLLKEGDRYPFDLSKPLPLQGRLGHLTVAADYFFNNDLEYLKSFDPERTYTTSITKTKAARYDIVGIEDMVPTLWSTIKHAYDKDAAKGIKHWCERRKLWYISQMNKFSKHNVYSTQKILGVNSVSVKKLHGYGHLEEAVVKRADQQLCKFKEGNFVDLHLNDIEDMLLLAVQHKLFHLNKSDITFPEIEFKELYTPPYKPPGVIYKDLVKQKRVMRADELYKFSDRTLKKVQDEL
ncbi:hypothetical protein Tco_0906301 [Tanacetum coccineum]